MKKIKLVLADGNRLFVESLQQILEKEMDTAVISGANSGVDALRSCIEIQPDIAVVGELLPDLSMVEAAKEIRRNVRNIRFVFMMRDGSADMLKQAQDTRDYVITAMNELRSAGDALETMVGKEYWPMPTYQDLLMSV